MPSKPFIAKITVTPDPDGIHCGSCKYLRAGWNLCDLWTLSGALQTEDDEDWNISWIRCESCLRAEEEAKV